ncbi:MBL fold metallo-hydrolase [Microbacterium sp. ASV49]|uniref:MBL fold metallo-hydrolase n=1 Tax=Microbacterium candidum TaxID=3041922 RepID=A0ABT7MUQ6_9MICO|nr:MBL fold metallo-hydrolase [Microbacterium sp. ASV49]MDL9978165.1 MBL fold metallo-hydrolase [Microbacterium sp. ASV49]
MELRPGLNRIGNDIVACYLVSDDDGITLIDAGIPGQWHDFLDELKAMGRPIEDVRGIVLTHGDSDHIGFAEKLRTEHGIPVYVHEADAARARGEGKSSGAWGSMRLGPTLGFLWYSARRGGLRPVYVKEVVAVQAGETLPLPGSPVIISMPGHSPGSIAVHVPEVDAVFVGDALTTRNVLTGVEGPAPAPFTDDPASALEALGHLTGLGVTWVLPGHGAPWSGGVDEAVRLVRAAADASGGSDAAGDERAA